VVLTMKLKQIILLSLFIYGYIIAIAEADPLRNETRKIHEINLPNGSFYRGALHDGLFDGEGHLENRKARFNYKGHFKEGLYHGEGILNYANGSRYEGGFKEGQRWGKGCFYHPNGDMYSGEFTNDALNGQGQVTFAIGGKYTGAFKDNEYSGKGVLAYPNGDEFEGEFLNGWRNGLGTFAAVDKKPVSGIWRNGKYMLPHSDNELPNDVYTHMLWWLGLILVSVLLYEWRARKRKKSS
jgi:hypothetical protein